MIDKIKVGVIGAGFIGPVHIESLRRLGFVEVVALATSGEETAKSKSRALSIPRAYGDWRDLMEDEEIQVVQITSPNYLHFPQAKAALQAGKHVVCDKPLTISPEESKELVDLVKEKELVGAITFNHRFYPLVQETRALLQEKALGEKLFFIRGGFHQDWLLYDTDYNWRVEAAKGGAVRAIGDLGTHWMDLIEHITDLRVEKVLADLACFIPVRKKPKGAIQVFADQELKATDWEEVQMDTEDMAIVLLKFSGVETRGLMTISQISAGRKCRLFYEISGSQGSAAWDSERANELWMGYRDKPNEILIKNPFLMHPSAKKYARYPAGHGEGFPDSHTACNRAIYEYIRQGKFKRGGEPDFPTFADGHHQQQLCEAILQSSREGKWINVGASY